MLTKNEDINIESIVASELTETYFVKNKVNEKTGNIYNSWIIHACANVAINSIGWTLL